MVKYLIGSVLIGVLSLTTLGCEARLTQQNNMQGDMYMGESHESLDAVSLIADIRFDDRILTVEYTIKNKSPKPIYVFNVLWEFGPDGKYISAPQPAYTLLRDNGTLHLAKVIPPLPKNKRVELKVVPFATKVEPGQEFSDKFEVTEPIAEYNPYFAKEGDAAQEIKPADSVVFSIQFVAEQENLDVKPAPFEKAWTVWHKELSAKIITLTSKPKAVLVNVNRRTDYFERF